MTRLQNSLREFRGIALPAELRNLIVAYLPNTQAVNYLARSMFDNNALENAHVYDSKEYNYLADLHQKYVHGFNNCMKRLNIAAQIIEQKEDPISFHHQPSGRFISDNDLMNLLACLIHDNLLWSDYKDDVISKFEALSTINSKLSSFGCRIQLVPIMIEVKIAVQPQRFA